MLETLAVALVLLWLLGLVPLGALPHAPMGLAPMVQLRHHSQGLLKTPLCSLPQGPWWQDGQQLPGLGLAALQHRQVVGVSVEVPGVNSLGGRAYLIDAEHHALRRPPTTAVPAAKGDPLSATNFSIASTGYPASPAAMACASSAHRLP
jgi:hypothetical protein